MSRTLIIGDIHGCYHELLDLLDRAALTDDDLLLSVGDLVDRGPLPSEVVALFRARKQSLVLCGNHERKHIRGVYSYSQQVCRLQMGATYDDDVRWMATLPYHYETPEVRVVHWGLYPGVPLAEVPEDVRAGTSSGDAKLRERYGDRPWYELYTDETPVVFGHAVVGAEPLIRDDRIYGLDTGACHGMRLTGLLLPERRIVSVPARADHWASVRRDWQGPVLRTYPWASMTFEQIHKKLKSLRDPELDEAYVLGVGRWADQVRGLLPALADSLDAEVVRTQAAHPDDEVPRILAAHAAGSWLLRRRQGRLSSEHLGCSTPEQVLTLAQALGVSASAVAAGPVP